jgi:hypothetical protein
MTERALNPGLRLLLGLIGVVGVCAGVAVGATELRQAYLGSPFIPTMLAALVAAAAAFGGGMLVRGGLRGRIAVRNPRGHRRDTHIN